MIRAGDQPITRAWIARLGPTRALRFASADAAADLPAHVRAGSGLRRWGDWLVVIQDDVHALALVDERTGVVAPLLLPAAADGRRQFSEGRGNKAAKMDLEACVVLADGRLLALGSGSTPARERLVVVDREHRVALLDGGPLFETLRGRPDFAGSELNLEGAVIVGERLWLFQRGNGATIAGRAPSNAIAELDLAAFTRWLAGAGPVPSVLEVRQVDLGQVDGVPFGFTDASALPDGRVVFLAGAEDSPDTYRDGEVLGAKVGLLAGEMLVLAEILDATGQPTRLKLEGIEFTGFGPAGALELLVVADMDDPDVPAVMAALTWAPR